MPTEWIRWKHKKTHFVQGLPISGQDTKISLKDFWTGLLWLRDGFPVWCTYEPMTSAITREKPITLGNAILKKFNLTSAEGGYMQIALWIELPSNSTCS